MPTDDRPTPPDDPFWYRAKLIREVDGDTDYFHADLGFDLRRYTEVRLNGIDTAEIFGVSHDSDEYALGEEEADFVAEWLDAVEANAVSEWPFVIHTVEKGKYRDRWVADVWSSNPFPDDSPYERSLAAEILSKYPDATYP